MKDNIKDAAESGMRPVVAEIGEGTIEDKLKVCYDEEKEGIETPIRSTGKEALIDIFEQGSHYSILVCKVDLLAELTWFMDALKRQVVCSTSIISLTPAFVKKHVDRMVEEVRFEKALENQL